MKRSLKQIIVPSCLVILSAPPAAFAHDAPSGWTYPLSCCSNQDCRRVTSSDVAETPNGYVVRSTGEVIPYNDKRVKRSGDNDMHLCQQHGDMDRGRVLCLFEPPRGF